MQPKLSVAIALAICSQGALAVGNTFFDDVGPNTLPNIPIPIGDALESTNALVLPSADWTQTSIANRNAQLALGQTNSGVWDMIDSNRTGADANRYLFMPFEPSNAGGVPNTGAGAQRYDTWTGNTLTIVDVGTDNFQRGDASRWTPWGGWLTAEENYNPNASVATGRLYEVTNPVDTTGPGDVNFVQRNTVLPFVSHEGLAFDSANSLYFVDELTGGSIYKYVADNPNAANGNDFFGTGTTFAMKVGAGSNSSAAGQFTWEALDPFTTNGRIAAAAVDATGYSRPEDLEIRESITGAEQLFFAATGTDDVWTMDLDSGEVFQFVTQSTLDIATGVAVGSVFNNPDNLAIDADGNIYIIEDQGAGSADIWRVVDVDQDGVAEGVSRWAAMQVTGAEPTGLFFSLADPNIAYVNIQHPSSGNDQLYQITATAPVPVPTAMWLFGSALAGLATRRAREAVPAV
ncbi:MAG: secreted PhoX family phosphatase [Gammaproteobacteria bacterium]|jgi:secreted PhoX family phosphatase